MERPHAKITSQRALTINATKDESFMYRETKEYMISMVKNGDFRDINHTSIENHADEIELKIMSEDSAKSGKQKLLGITYTIEEASEIIEMFENVIHRAKQSLQTQQDSKS